MHAQGSLAVSFLQEAGGDSVIADCQGIGGTPALNCNTVFRQADKHIKPTGSIPDRMAAQTQNPVFDPACGDQRGDIRIAGPGDLESFSPGIGKRNRACGPGHLQFCIGQCERFQAERVTAGKDIAAFSEESGCGAVFLAGHGQAQDERLIRSAFRNPAVSWQEGPDFIEKSVIDSLYSKWIQPWIGDCGQDSLLIGTENR